MAVNTLANFISAVNAASGVKSGATYAVQGSAADGSLAIYQYAKGATAPVLWAYVLYSTNPDWSAATDANPSGAGVIVRMFEPGVTGAQLGSADSMRYKDAQGFINELLAS